MKEKLTPPPPATPNSIEQSLMFKSRFAAATQTVRIKREFDRFKHINISYYTSFLKPIFFSINGI